MTQPTFFVATPIHTSQLHCRWVAGALQATAEFAGRIRIETQIGSFLPRNRDLLTKRFLDSPASHMLCVDSDIGWSPRDVEALVAVDKDFVSGTYAKKQPNCEIPARPIGEATGELLPCDFVPAGFLMLTRACVERMVGAYRNLEYETKEAGRLWALWSSLYSPGKSYDGEDVAFCRRWTAIGGEIWLHTGVVLPHYGEHAYLPEQDAKAPQATPSPTA